MISVEMDETNSIQLSDFRDKLASETKLRPDSSSYKKWSRNGSVDSHQELNRLNFIEKQRHLLEMQRQDRLFMIGTNDDETKDHQQSRKGKKQTGENESESEIMSSDNGANPAPPPPPSNATPIGIEQYKRSHNLDLVARLRQSDQPTDGQIDAKVERLEHTKNIDTVTFVGDNIDKTHRRGSHDEALEALKSNRERNVDRFDGSTHARENDDSISDNVGGDSIRAQTATVKTEGRHVESSNYFPCDLAHNPLVEILDQDNMVKFAGEPVPPNMTYQCLIVRDKTGLNKSFYPTYYLILQAIINNNNNNNDGSSNHNNSNNADDPTQTAHADKSSANASTTGSLANFKSQKCNNDTSLNKEHHYSVQSGPNNRAQDEGDEAEIGSNEYFLDDDCDSLTDSFSNASIDEEEDLDDDDVMEEANSGSGIGHCGSISRDISDDFKDDLAYQQQTSSSSASNNNNNISGSNGNNVATNTNHDSSNINNSNNDGKSNSNPDKRTGRSSGQQSNGNQVLTTIANLRSSSPPSLSSNRQAPAVVGQQLNSLHDLPVSKDQMIVLNENQIKDRQAHISVGVSAAATATTTTSTIDTRKTKGTVQSVPAPNDESETATTTTAIQSIRITLNNNSNSNSNNNNNNNKNNNNHNHHHDHPSSNHVAAGTMATNRHHPRPSIILTGRRRKKTKTYLIALDEHDITRKKSICKLKSNVLGTQFNAVRIRKPDGGVHQRFNLASINYETNVLGFKGPRKMNIIIPNINYLWDENLNLYEESKKLNSQYIIQIRNKTPTWNEESQSYVLNFHGRVTQASVKNFQLIYIPRLPKVLDKDNTVNISDANSKSVEPGKRSAQRDSQSNQEAPNNINAKRNIDDQLASVVFNQHQSLAYNDFMIMQFGRISEREFTCDVSHPLSLLQAFSIALSSFDSKLACE